MKKVFDGSLSTPTLSLTDSDTTKTSEEEHKIFRFFEDKEPEEESYPGINYINGTFWEKFTKKRKLGEGTSGIVRKCIRKEDGKEFAVKIVRTRDDEIIFHVKAILNLYF